MAAVDAGPAPVLAARPGAKPPDPHIARHTLRIPQGGHGQDRIQMRGG